MKPVARHEIVDYATYEDGREAFRREVFAVKQPRRVHLGEHLTLLFENRTTIRYQVQEMMRAERIVREADIQHELDTYNEILGGDGELGCTLLVEIDDPAVRAEKLVAWRALPEHLYVLLADGTRVRPSFDERQRDTERLSSVQYLKFPVGAHVPVGVGADLPGLLVESSLSPEQRAALREDLGLPER